MSLSHHQRQMYRIEAGLLRADPQVASMLGVFGRLSTGEAMPSWDQVSSPGSERTRRGRGAGGRPDLAGQAYG